MRDAAAAAAPGAPRSPASGRSLTTFAPGGEELMKSLATQSLAAATDMQGGRERPDAPTSDAMASVQPGVRSLDGRSSQAQITVGTPARLVIAGFASGSICDLQVRVLSRALPDTYPQHQEEHLSPDSNFHRMPGDGASVASALPQRELPVKVIGGDFTSLCAGGAPAPEAMRPQAYSLVVVIPPRLNNGQRTGGFEDDPAAAIEVRADDGTTYQMTDVTLVAMREPLHLTIYRAGPPQAVYKVVYGDWKPLGVAPYRFAEGPSIDCPSNGGGDLVTFNGMKHGFALVSANMITDRVDTGDGDGFHNAGSRVMFGDYAIVFNDDHSFFANWGVWRSHRSEIGMTSGMGAVVDARPPHDICLSNYYLSVTVVGPLDMVPW